MESVDMLQKRDDSHVCPAKRGIKAGCKKGGSKGKDW